MILYDVSLWDLEETVLEKRVDKRFTRGVWDFREDYNFNEWDNEDYMDAETFLEEVL